LDSFLTERYRTLEAIDSIQPTVTRFRSSKPTISNPSPRVLQSFSTRILHTSKICDLCYAENHPVRLCPRFLQMTIVDRTSYIQKKQLCSNCFASGHPLRNCTSAHNCLTCHGRHHTLLHPSDSSSSVPIPRDNTRQISPPIQRISHLGVLAAEHQRPVLSNHASVIDVQQVVLATAVVHIKGSSCQIQPARVLLDSGSQVNFITEEMARGLQLKRIRKEVNLLGIGKSTVSAHQVVQTTISSRVHGFQMVFDFVVLKSISSHHPEKGVDCESLNIPKNLPLADPGFHKPQKIDLLLGADELFDLLKDGQIKQKNTLILQNTVFGWVVSGRYRSKDHQRTEVCSMVSTVNESGPLEKLVKRFWELEQVPNVSEDKRYTPEEMLCEKIFRETVVRLPSGRLQVSLPFKSSPTCLGSSFEMARRRFLSLERRLSKNPNTQLMFNQFMEEYLALGHMTAIEGSIPKDPHCFIPYQCVERPQSKSTKLRVVFDASCKTTSQMSLNDLLMVGATILACLYSTLLRFRCRKFALVADITKMYRQVEIDEAQRIFQLIVWRRDPVSPLEIYRLNTVTYGTASAPFLAVRCLKYLSDSHLQSHPRGA
ncbi:hypothetical protein KR059_011228, partial [Drosophila kikkawai]